MLTQDQLNATYREVLGRDAPTSDLAAWNNVGGSINDYRNALIATPEFGERYGNARRSMSPDDPRLNPVGFDPIAARQGPAFTQTVTGQPLPAAQPPAMQPPMAQPGGATGRGYSDPNRNPFEAANGGQPDWLGGILGQLFGGGMGSPNMLGRPAAGGGMGGGGGQYDFGGIWSKGGPFAPTPYPGDGMGGERVDGRQAGGYGGMARLGDLFGGGAGMFGSGAMGGQSTNAMSNPLSASPFGRNFSTRQMGIPARTMI
jgi:hypothetical protein